MNYDAMFQLSMTYKYEAGLVEHYCHLIFKTM